MRFRLGRRAATAAAVAALTCSGLGIAAGQASAAGNTDISLYGYHGVGVYEDPSASFKVGIPDLTAPAYVSSDCWRPGQYIGNDGDVWYHVYQEHYSNGQVQYNYGYVYAPYVDNSDAFRRGDVPRCPWG
ncbi:hypothetical protein [Streptomyces sp. NBC_01431]|uniref:hypothetical protein n=1 Tax=Streptomyces sp. NBC_01431 TaxID=2903863 RepID=UPI002E30F1CF|nr:hypothetical protein [Streptomyces sp. NBC_01431]